jgi:hypothetical protein
MKFREQITDRDALARIVRSNAQQDLRQGSA